MTPTTLFADWVKKTSQVHSVKVLPGAHRSQESGMNKSVALRIDGDKTELLPSDFSPNWFSGVSILKLTEEDVAPLLRNDETRTRALAALVAAIPSEMADADVEVGPLLEHDDEMRDTAAWQFGFDAPSCCVGLYSAVQQCGSEGIERRHNVYYLVCKAGGGVAAQTFHSRFCAGLADGKSLDELMRKGGNPGLDALRRVSESARRNRGRMLVAAVKALGIYAVDTIGDSASVRGSNDRLAIPSVDVSMNTLRKLEDERTSVWQYTCGCVDASISQGLVCASNPSEGFVLFTTQSGDMNIKLRNGSLRAKRDIMLLCVFITPLEMLAHLRRRY